MSDGAFAIGVIVLAGWVIIGVLWEHAQQRARNLDEAEHHAALMRELRRHDQASQHPARRMPP